MSGEAGVPLSDELVAEIAAALDARCELAPFRVNEAAVYRVSFTPPGKARVQLTLWPSLARADVLAADCAVVFKGIDRVLLFPGIEVIFQRRGQRGFLTVHRSGRVATAS
jgi:D-aminopeptidase